MPTLEYTTSLDSWFLNPYPRFQSSGIGHFRASSAHTGWGVPAICIDHGPRVGTLHWSTSTGSSVLRTKVGLGENLHVWFNWVSLVSMAREVYV
jgi:hypothetical protein